MGPSLAARCRWSTGVVGVVTLFVLGAGCQRRIAVDTFPPGALPVRFVPAANYTDCLVASVVMCANYVTASERFEPAIVREGLTAAGLDPTRIADLRVYLAGRRLTLQPLTGSFTDRELVGLGWWLLQGGYPVICVMNKNAGNADYNHAVVVIGVGRGDSVASARTVHYLDPASPRRLESVDRLLFRHYWASAGHIMLPLFETPGEVAGATAPTGVSR